MNSQRRAHQHSPNVVPHSHSQRIPVHIQRRANPPAHSQSSLTSTLRLASRLGPLQDSLRFKTLFASRPASLQDPLRFKTRFASRPASLQETLRSVQETLGPVQDSRFLSRRSRRAHVPIHHPRQRYCCSLDSFSIRSWYWLPLAPSAFALEGVSLAPFQLTNSFDAVMHVQESPPHKRLVVGCGSPFMRLAEHLTVLRAWCKQCGPGRRKPGMLRPSIVGMCGSMDVRLRPALQ